MNWKRPSKCESGHCVLVAFDGERVKVRDSKEPSARAIVYDRHSWQLMLDAIKFGGHTDEIVSRLADVIPLPSGRLCWYPDDVGHLHFTWDEIDAFVKGAQAGEFDLPEPSHV